LFNVLLFLLAIAVVAFLIVSFYRDFEKHRKKIISILTGAVVIGGAILIPPLFDEPLPPPSAQLGVEPSYDGYVRNVDSVWADGRSANAGDVVGTSNTALVQGGAASITGENYYIFRVFFEFDTSGIGSGQQIDSAYLRISPYLLYQSDVIAIKSTQGTGDVVVGDFDEIDFSTTYSNSVSWSSAEKHITLNSDFFDDVDMEGNTFLALVEYTHDQQNVAPGTLYRNGMYMSEHATASLRPKLFINYSAANSAPTASSPSPSQGETDVVLTPELTITVDDVDDDNLDVYWYYGSNGTSWTHFQSNLSLTGGSLPTTVEDISHAPASSYNTEYEWKVAVDDGTDNESFFLSFTTEEEPAVTWHTNSFGVSVTVTAGESVSWQTNSFGVSVTVADWGEWSSYWKITQGYNETLRLGGYDYFVWLGKNCTLSDVKDNISALDESDETISVLNHTDNQGHWCNLSGTDVGEPTEEVNTFDVIRTDLDGSGTININVSGNPEILLANYENRTFSLVYHANGYNFTGFSNGDGSTLSAENSSIFTSPGDDFYWLALWNETSYTWQPWFCGWGCVGSGCDEEIWKWDVIMTKIKDNKNWDQS